MNTDSLMPAKEEFYRDISSIVGVEISDSTVFFEDLGIDGLDALTLMEDVSKKYNIDLSDYDPEIYHTSEADITNFFKTIYLLIFNRKKRTKAHFTASHLYEVVKQKRWVHPIM